MMNSHPVNRLVEELTQRLGSARDTALSSSALRSLVQEAVARLDLVTREDYERLLQIHQRTRCKVDELAARLDQLQASEKDPS